MAFDPYRKKKGSKQDRLISKQDRAVQKAERKAARQAEHEERRARGESGPIIEWGAPYDG